MLKLGTAVRYQGHRGKVVARTLAASRSTILTWPAAAPSDTSAKATLRSSLRYCLLILPLSKRSKLG